MAKAMAKESLKAVCWLRAARMREPWKRSRRRRYLTRSSPEREATWWRVLARMMKVCEARRRVYMSDEVLSLVFLVMRNNNKISISPLTYLDGEHAYSCQEDEGFGEDGD